MLEEALGVPRLQRPASWAEVPEEDQREIIQFEMGSPATLGVSSDASSRSSLGSPVPSKGESPTSPDVANPQVSHSESSSDPTASFAVCVGDVDLDGCDDGRHGFDRIAGGVDVLEDLEGIGRGRHFFFLSWLRTCFFGRA